MQYVIFIYYITFNNTYLIILPIYSYSIILIIYINYHYNISYYNYWSLNFILYPIINSYYLQRENDSWR